MQSPNTSSVSGNKSMFYYFHQYLPENVKQVHDIIGTCLATAAFAVKATIHQTLQTMPGA